MVFTQPEFAHNEIHHYSNVYQMKAIDHVIQCRRHYSAIGKSMEEEQEDCGGDYSMANRVEC